MFITEKNYNRVHVIGEKNGKCITITVKEILDNALRQERNGIAPHYVLKITKRSQRQDG